MESFGVASAVNSSQQRPRFISIRGVSDHADELKDDNYRQEALSNASDCLFSFLKTGILSASNSNLNSSSKKLIAIHHTSLDRRTSLVDSIYTNIHQLRDYSIQEIEINQSSFYKGGRLVMPGEAFKIQKSFDKKLNHLIEKYPDALIGYFALAHIPFMFHLGYEANIREVQVFASHRQARYWKALQDGDATWQDIRVENISKQTNVDVEEVIIRMSISYPILIEQIKGVVDITSKPIIHITVADPMPDLVNYETQLNEYASAFYQTLVNIKKFFPRAKLLHVFFSGPPTLAFRCGQQINRTIDPDVIVYNYSNKDEPNYGWALNIQKEKILEFRESDKGDKNVQFA
jgi:hypothetical protein